MSRQSRLALAVLGAGILIAILMVVLRPKPEEIPRDDHAPLVRTVPFERQAGPLTVLGAGTVQSSEEVALGAQISGQLVYVNPAFREGNLVSAGANLFRIDPADYRNQVRIAQAEVAAQEVVVLEARERVEIARGELNRFSRREDQRGLLESTIDESDHASRILPPRALMDEASGPESLADRSASGPNTLATREPQLRSAQAARERAAAQLADARLALGRTEVRAPFSGIVRSENAAVGKLVQPGQELGTLVAASSFEVRVSLTEGEAALVPGLLNGRKSRIPAGVFFDYGGLRYRWSAYVDRADPILDADTRTIDVFLRVPDPMRGGVLVEGMADGPAPPLLIGSFVRAEIIGSSSVPFAAVPASALQPGNQIWVVRGGRLRILPVRVIQRTDEIAFVTTPSLAQGGRLVTSSLRAPVDGMKVRMENKERGASKTFAKPAATDDE